MYPWQPPRRAAYLNPLPEVLGDQQSAPGPSLPCLLAAHNHREGRSMLPELLSRPGGSNFLPLDKDTEKLGWSYWELRWQLKGFTKGLYVTSLSYALRPCHCPAAISVFLCVYLWTYTVSYMSQLLSFPHSPPENLIPSKYPFSIIHREAKNTKPPPSLIRKQGNRKQRMWVSPAHCPTKMVPYYMPEGCQGDCCSFCLAEQVSHH